MSGHGGAVGRAISRLVAWLLPERWPPPYSPTCRRLSLAGTRATRLQRLVVESVRDVTP